MINFGMLPNKQQDALVLDLLWIYSDDKHGLAKRIREWGFAFPAEYMFALDNTIRRLKRRGFVTYDSFWCIWFISYSYIDEVRSQIVQGLGRPWSADLPVIDKGN